MPDDRARLAALTRYNILDTATEPAFDRITATLARLLDVPIALVSFVDEDRQWFKSSVGLDARETPRSIAFCAHAIEHDEPFVIPDALADDRFRDNPLVTGAPHIRSYAGAPLITADGFRLGTLCAIDREPRQLSADQLLSLADLARVVVDLMELRIARREQRVLARSIQISPNVVYLLELASNRTVWSSRSTAALLGYDVGAMGNELLPTLLHPDDVERVRDHISACARLPDERHLELAYRIRAADGTYRWFLARGGVFERDATGVATELIGIATDVTQLKEIELRLLEVLGQKEVLIKEIHHRVGNNLAVVSSLLSLQARAATTEQTRAQLEISQTRVRSIGLVHEHLYSTDKPSQIDLSAYLRALVVHLRVALGASSREIEVRVEGDRTELDAEHAVPCGLLVSELVTNSLKHAFTGRQHGVVAIEVRRVAEMIEVEVRDDGVGISDARAKQGSLGLEIVHEMARQLGGTLEIDGAPEIGTRVTVRFKGGDG